MPLPPAPNCTLCTVPVYTDAYAQRTTHPYTGFERDLCPPCRYINTCHFWSNSTDWQQLLWLNLDYIYGLIDCSPAYPSDPISRETRPLVPNLTQLHAYGLLTADSQPFMDSKEAKGRRGHWEQRVQRPYVWFLVPTAHEELPVEKVDGLIEKIMAHPELVATVHAECAVYGDSSPAPLDAPYAEQRYRFRTNTIPGDNVASRTRTGTWGSIRIAQWVGDCWFTVVSVRDLKPGDCLCGPDEDGECFEVVNGMRPLAVGVMAKQWGRNVELLGVLVQICEEVGLRRVFDTTVVEEEE